MYQKMLYEPPVAETYELVIGGGMLLFSGENRNEKFDLNDEAYDDSDFV